MPSLRRTASSPAVRSSPYSSGLNTARGSGHRRSSGSETTNRRVLADIEWWRVTEGQREPSADQESEDRFRGNQDIVSLDMSLGAVGIHITHVGVDPLPLPLPWTPAPAVVSDETLANALPTEQFSGLSITPHTPIRRRHSLESSSSSLESTPEVSEATLEGSAQGMSDLDMGFEEAAIPPLPIQRRNRFSALSPFLLRPFTLADCFSGKDDESNQYADFAVSPLSSAPGFLN